MYSNNKTYIKDEIIFSEKTTLKINIGGKYMFKKTLKITAIVGALVMTMGIIKPIEADAATVNGTATATINVRSGASTKYKSIGKIKKGTKVKIVSTKNGWHKVKYSNKTGWSIGKYIKKSSSSSSVKKRITVKAYAYTGGGYTATGTKAKYGTLAVDPKVIPYGTKIYIKELDKVFTAEDCGGGIKGNKIDIYMNSSSACNKWGVRTITLQILK